MSRLPCNEPSQPLEQRIFHVTTVDDLPISSKEIREATQSDPTLSRVLDYTLNGWPDKSSDENLKPYYYRRVELSIENGCILWGARVVIPPRFREQLPNELHLEHQGITRTKAFARSYLWWPKLDSDIESLISSCLVARLYNQNLQRHLCTFGHMQLDHGSAYILIMLKRKVATT